MAFSPSWLDELRARTTLSSLLGQSIKLTKAGNEYKACCPFHNEKTPSFYVNDAKGFYHCFGCSAHGDAIRWMTEYRGLGFVDAVKELAAAANMELPKQDPQEAKRQEKRASLFDVMEAAQELFVDQLQGLDGAQARDYLQRRGISAETAKTFGFGFAPDSRGRLKRELARFDIEQLVEAGLLIAVDGKDPYDRFRGRLMIPIRDARGRVIAFGGRILGEGEPKYLNSPDTPLFDKGRTLYNLDLASNASRQTGRLIVVEGYMDAIALSQAGFQDVVAPLGTALTETQIEMCWKLAEKPVLCFDGDKAGQKAAMRAVGRALPLLRPSHSLKFAHLPAGKDPDDLLQDEGTSAMRKVLDSALPLVEQLWRTEEAAEPLDTPEDRAGLKQRLNDHVSAIADKDIASHYRQNLREKYDELFFQKRSTLPFEKRKAGFRPPMRVRSETRALRSKQELNATWMAVIAGLLNYPGKITDHFEVLQNVRIADTELQALLVQMLQSAMEMAELVCENFDTILQLEQFSEIGKRLKRADNLNYSFSRKCEGDIARNRAERELDEAILALAHIPRLESALRQANIRVNEELTEETYGAQQQLRAQLQEQLDRLKQVGQTEDVI